MALHVETETQVNPIDALTQVYGALASITTELQLKGALPIVVTTDFEKMLKIMEAVKIDPLDHEPELTFSHQGHSKLVFVDSSQNGVRMAITLRENENGEENTLTFSLEEKVRDVPNAWKSRGAIRIYESDQREVGDRPQFVVKAKGLIGKTQVPCESYMTSTTFTNAHSFFKLLRDISVGQQ